MSTGAGEVVKGPIVCNGFPGVDGEETGVLLPFWESSVCLMTPFQNRLLALVLPEDLRRLGKLEVEALSFRASLESSNDIITDVFFLESGFASVVSEDPGRGAVEVGVIGSEGMTGLAIVQGASTTPFHTYMQNSGSGIRVGSSVLQNALEQSVRLRRLLGRYVLAFSVQIASTAAANGRGLLEERLARWLLMVADRVGDQVSITHEFLGLMLSAQRPGVTLALQALESKGMIQSRRGCITIVDRDALVAFTRGLYGTAEREYRQLLS